MICELLRDKLHTTCSIKGIDKILNIVYNKHTRRSRVQIRAVMLFLTHTGARIACKVLRCHKNTQCEERI